MGRFMQQDTLFGEMERPLTQNLYIYCLNNGVNLRDPSGNRSVDLIKADVNRYKDQLASAKSAGAGQSVYDGIQKTIDSLIKELGNELSKPKPKPNPSPKPPKKPDWGDISNPYNPVNNPNSAGSILSGADGYWGNNGGSSGGGESETDTSVPAITEWQRKLAEMYKNGQLGLMERAYFEKNILPKLPNDNIDKLLGLNGKPITVYNDGNLAGKAVVNLTKEEYEALYRMCSLLDIEPTLILAIIAHESRFNANAVNTTINNPQMQASGYMQVLPRYFLNNLNNNNEIKEIAFEYAGDDIHNILNPYANIASGINQLASWRDQYRYGKNDMLKAYAQGVRGTGWGDFAITSEREFLDIKGQLDLLMGDK